MSGADVVLWAVLALVMGWSGVMIWLSLVAVWDALQKRLEEGGWD